MISGLESVIFFLFHRRYFVSKSDHCQCFGWHWKTSHARNRSLLCPYKRHNARSKNYTGEHGTVHDKRVPQTMCSLWGITGHTTTILLQDATSFSRNLLMFSSKAGTVGMAKMKTNKQHRKINPQNTIYFAVANVGRFLPQLNNFGSTWLCLISCFFTSNRYFVVSASSAVP